MEARKLSHTQELKEFEFTTNPYYRATMLAPTHPLAQLMLRSEDSNFRRVERLTTMTTMLFEGDHSRPKFEAAAVTLLRYIEDNADGFRILVRDSSPASGGGTYGTLLSDIAGQVEYIMADFLKSRGRDPKLAPMYSQMLVGMVAFTGQWWLDARKPKLEQVAANMIDLAWNGLAQLDAKA